MIGGFDANGWGGLPADPETRQKFEAVVERVTKAYGYSRAGLRALLADPEFHALFPMVQIGKKP